MSEEEVRVFVDGAIRYFDRVTRQPAEVETPYLKGDETVTLDFTGVIGISGRHRGAVYYTAGAELLTALLRVLGEKEVSFPDLEDLVGEVANTIAGSARSYFGSEFLISVPVVLWGRPDKITFPRNLKTFVVPIVWQGYRSYLLICLDRNAGGDRDSGG